jgi:hypothetical protein
MTDSLFDTPQFTPGFDYGRARMDAAREAARKGMEAVEAHADADWSATAYGVIEELMAGGTFLAEDLVPIIERRGPSTHDRKALGPVILKAARAGLIEKTGKYLPAASSNGQPKPEWRRL